MSIFQQIGDFGVVPVIAISDASQALALADALIEGGLPVAEITLRTPAALEAINLIARHRTQVLIGAGTVLDENQVEEAKSAGAQFALSPGIDKGTVEFAKKLGLPFAPGIMTPSDLQLALRLNCDLVKFFPAETSGGVTLLKSIAGPYSHTGIGFNPTGGVTLDNMHDWFEFEPVKAVGGTWIAKNSDIAEGNWGTISENARHAVAKVSELRRD